jgi:hypothetical protein
LLPNFLIIGAARSGTSSLYSYLQEHPDVYLPRTKRPEPHFFFKASEYARGIDDYEARYFSEWSGEKAVGEASTSYLFGPETPARIAAHLGDVRLIAMLRNPIERAHSSYWHTVRSGLETLDFDEAVLREDERTAALEGSDLAEIKPYSYLARGLYFQQLSRWYEVFEEKQLHVVLFDDFVSDTRSVLRGILSFLGVDAGRVPEDLGRIENRSTPDEAMISDGTLRHMRSYFAEDVRALERLLSRDLSGWLA